MQELQETRVCSLGQEDSLEGKWQPTPVFLPRELYGLRSMAGSSPWAHEKLNTTEHAHLVSISTLLWFEKFSQIRTEIMVGFICYVSSLIYAMYCGVSEGYFLK